MGVDTHSGCYRVGANWGQELSQLEGIVVSARDDDALRELEARLTRDDPELARAFAAGLSADPRKSHKGHRRQWASLIAIVGSVVLVLGVISSHRLLVWAGFLLLGLALFFRIPSQPR